MSVKKRGECLADDLCWKNENLNESNFGHSVDRPNKEKISNKPEDIIFEKSSRYLFNSNKVDQTM